MGYIRVYLPASGYNNTFNLEFVHLLQLSVMRNSTWLGSCLIMTFPMKAIFHASLVLWNILLMEASYAGYISFCHQVSYYYYYYYYYYSLYHYVICMIASFWLHPLKTFRVFFSSYKQISLAFFNPFARNRPCGSRSFLPFVTWSVLTVKDNFLC